MLLVTTMAAASLTAAQDFAYSACRHFALLLASGWGRLPSTPLPPSSKYTSYAVLDGVPAYVAALRHLDPRSILEAFQEVSQPCTLAPPAQPPAHHVDVLVHCRALLSRRPRSVRQCSAAWQCSWTRLTWSRLPSKRSLSLDVLALQVRLVVVARRAGICNRSLARAACTLADFAQTAFTLHGSLGLQNLVQCEPSMGP